ncbi:MAG TPA: hypothetical protein PKH77_13080 [Anaerolineae bacterium]|nr:hypothetical protein [Anaerolineae bacterium]
MKQGLRLLIPTIFLLMGLFYFLEPFLSGWFEIVDPFIYRTIFLPVDWIIFFGLGLPFFRLSEKLGPVAEDIAFGLIFILYLFYFFKVVRRRWAEEKCKKLALVPIIVCCLMWCVTLPLGGTYNARRFNAFRVGGWTRLICSGGATRVRTDALEFIQETTQATPPRSEWPSSLQRLGYGLKIEHDNRLVLVGLGRAIGMAAEFGFIIQDSSASPPIPHYLERDGENPQLWRLADGIYFFMN